MTTTPTSDNYIKAAISVSEMCRQLNMSRSQFYAHVKRGTFHSPLYLKNNRPFFNASMAADNIRVRETGVGVDGEFVIFYQRLSMAISTTSNKTSVDRKALIDSLKSLGLESVSTRQVDAAIASCFPKGTDCEDENTLLRAVFRHLKHAETV